MRALSAVMAVAAAACYRPAPEAACEVRCEVSATERGPCPGSLVCEADGLCHVPGESCGPVGDAGVDTPDAASACPPGTSLAFADGFDGTALAGWRLVTPGDATATVSGGVVRVARIANNGSFLRRTSPPPATTLRRVHLAFDVDVAGAATHDGLLAQIEIFSAVLNLVQLRVNSMVTIRQASDGAVEDLGTPMVPATGLAHVVIDADLAARTMTVDYAGTVQSFGDLALEPGAILEVLVGTFLFDATPGGRMDFDNVTVCIANS